MTSHAIVDTGGSRSFPVPHAFLDGAAPHGEVTVYVGAGAVAAYRPDPTRKAILVELGTECLGEATGEGAGLEGSNTLGFARFRLGDGEPSDLVELVRQPATDPAAIEVATAMFETAGLQVSVCADFAGRILDRLIRPYYNEALTRLDEGLATAADMDLTVKLGLGYPEGPIELLERTGLHHHHDVTRALFETYGTRHYAPARRAVVARRRADREAGE
ncbi:3-hydroxyacyl-CoA dehydrogenase family protein [Thalassobaculum sp.]|uniref:3-hydroxyacyl-CoA dehydrogenase family protein n=1 Tax=Thalassobaculum sp. TaxID=2022740 RepID=UPI0032EF6519